MFEDSQDLDHLLVFGKICRFLGAENWAKLGKRPILVDGCRWLSGVDNTEALGEEEWVMIFMRLVGIGVHNEMPT